MSLCDNCMNFPCTDDMSVMLKSCPAYSPIPKPQTNADRIRSMSDEELAVWIAETSCCSDWCILRDACDKKQEHECCINVWLNWLKKQAEEGET